MNGFRDREKELFYGTWLFAWLFVVLLFQFWPGLDGPRHPVLLNPEVWFAALPVGWTLAFLWTRHRLSIRAFLGDARRKQAESGLLFLTIGLLRFNGFTDTHLHAVSILSSFCGLLIIAMAVSGAMMERREAAAAMPSKP